MGKIIKLDSNLANQIAAGEVVERPLSVVKELVENSIDALANDIKIEIINGGIDKIIITDNGEGIQKDDLPLVAEKYSTSKIKSLDDLYNVMTFGFRGEAISAISSVSKFEIISKKSGEDFGYSLNLENNFDKKILEHPINKGTKIIVGELFHNTPARLNYLKKARTEYTHILGFLQNITLSYPEVGFELISDNKSIFKYKPQEDLKTRIYNVFGDSFSSNLIEIKSSFTGGVITGFISDPKVSFPNRNRQVLFVNKRCIKSPLIFKAISNAYNRFIPHSSFPGFILNIQIDPTQVDVNVHPRKMEVRFADESNIFRSFFHSIEDKLNKVSLITNNSSYDKVELNKNVETHCNIPLQNTKKKKNDNYYTGSGTKFKSYSPYKDTSPNPNQTQLKNVISFSKEILNNSKNVQNDGIVSNENSGDLHITPIGKIIGQTFNSYIIVETEEGLKILDQHALAERIIYEKLIRKDGLQSISTQGLLIGETFNLTPKEYNILNENKQIFEDIGFDFELLSNKVVILNGIPDFIKKENIENIFLGIISDIGEENFSKSKTIAEVRNKIYAYASCRAAIKFGNKLNLFEINKLLKDSVIDYSSTCPHGRPVIFEINLEELKNKYER